MITPKVITGPTLEPVSVEEAKDHLRITHDDEDHLVWKYIRAARRYFEWRTGRALFTQTLEIAFDKFPSDKLILPRATPLQSITSVKYTDSGGTENTWDSSLYVFSTYEEPGYIAPAYGESFPSFTAYPVDPIVVRYIAGTAYASVDEFPEDYKVPILLLVGGEYENREVYSLTPSTAKVIPYGVESYIAQAMVRNAN